MKKNYNFFLDKWKKKKKEREKEMGGGCQTGPK